MLDVGISGFDGRAVDTKKHPIETIFFERTNPESSSTRTLKFKNQNDIPVQFHWSLYKDRLDSEIILDEESTHYTIEPSQGKINAGAEIEF